MSTTMPPSPLRYLHPGWFTLVMGWVGLSLAWWRAAPLMGGVARWVGLLAGAMAAALFVGLATVSVWRALRERDAWRDDLQHPIRHAFVAAIPVSMILLATVMAGIVPALSRGLLAIDGQTWAISTSTAEHWMRVAELLWMTGALALLWVTAWVLARWWRAGRLLAGVTPVHLIPIVGHVLTPLAGVALGHEAWAASQFLLGLLLWPWWVSLMWRRRHQGPPLPDRLAPTRFIQLAPLAVIGLSTSALGLGLWAAALTWLLGLALLVVLWRELGATLQGMPFGLPHWGLSFPLAAWSSLTWLLALDPALRQIQGATQVLAVGVLAVVTLVILGLSSATIKGVRSGQLLAPEPSPGRAR
jgi:tellurite resistance protein